MISTAVVSAAGRGTRMKELTIDKPKHLLEVKGRPFISYLLDNLVEAGIENILLVVGHRKDRFDEFLSQNDYPIIVVDQTDVVGDDYGTAIPIKSVEKLIGNQQFISLAGDHLYDVNDINKISEENDWTYIGATRVKNPKGFGCLKIKEDQLLEEIVEKPDKPPSKLINISMYKFTSEIFPIISQLTLSERGEYEITDAINILAKQSRVKVIEVDRFYLDFGRPQDIKKMEKLLKK
ncbi:sugar phosphate nucleotidyltransferase [Patescibacteria group bacterium]